MYSNMYSKMISKYQNKYENKYENKNSTNKQNKKIYKVKIIRRIIPADADLSSVLGKKRNYATAFSQETYDDFRYGQHIDIKFFEKNIGHIVL